jgi:hypothetical protein
MDALPADPTVIHPMPLRTIMSGSIDELEAAAPAFGKTP